MRNYRSHGRVAADPRSLNILGWELMLCEFPVRQDLSPTRAKIPARLGGRAREVVALQSQEGDGGRMKNADRGHLRTRLQCRR